MPPRNNIIFRSIDHISHQPNSMYFPEFTMEGEWEECFVLCILLTALSLLYHCAPFLSKYPGSAPAHVTPRVHNHAWRLCYQVHIVIQTFNIKYTITQTKAAGTTMKMYIYIAQ